MAVSKSAGFVDLQTLPPGFHVRRFAVRGAGFDAFIWRGRADGPVLLLNGATHGDEYEGPTVLRAWAARWRPIRLRGTVVMVPVLNEGAFFAGTRCHPADGANLARSFPGAAHGAVSARLAHLFDTRLLAQCSHYVDLHSAGAAYELLPWTGYLTRSDGLARTQRAMASCFGGFWCWAAPFLPGRTLSAAHTRNIPAVYVECRGAGGVDPRDVRALDRGIENLLRCLGSVPGKFRAARQLFRETDDAGEAHLQIHHPAPHHGLFVPRAKLGASVRRGEILGAVHPLGTLRPTAVRAARAGRVVMVRRQRAVRSGEALFVLAPSGSRDHASRPPSTTHVVPVTKRAPGEQTKATVSPISDVRPRPSGVRSRTS